MSPRTSLLLKLLAVLAIGLLLAAVLARIGFLVDERRAYQRQAEESVKEAHAGAQTLLGPLLWRSCSEEWQQLVGRGREQRQETLRRDFTLQATPDTLAASGEMRNETRHRGLFKVNGYLAQLNLQARWGSLDALRPQREHAGSRLSCGPLLAWLSTSDVRGLRSARIALLDEAAGESAASPGGPGPSASSGSALMARPGVPASSLLHGLHASLPAAWWPESAAPAPSAPVASLPARALALQITLDLVGTAQFALVPAAESTRLSLRSDWPHPSFIGRFLPQGHAESERGFEARWELSALASSAGSEALAGALPCGAQPPGKPCLDHLAVAFIDPVNPYVLADRAVKYGLLFIALTFAAVGLTEALGAGRVRRVHPLQYGFVGLALALFFLLLLSLSEHLGFGTAYAVAAAACVGLLGLYARHMLGRLRDGLVFGAGMAGLYALLYQLLQREQTALVIGAVGLFTALARVMWLTRRVDWYGLADGLAPAVPGDGARAGTPASTVQA